MGRSRQYSEMFGDSTIQTRQSFGTDGPTMLTRGRVTGLLAMGAFVLTACILTSQSVPTDHRRLGWLDVTVYKFGSFEKSSCFNDATTCDGYLRYNKAQEDLFFMFGDEVKRVTLPLKTIASVKATGDDLDQLIFVLNASTALSTDALFHVDDPSGSPDECLSIKVGGLDKDEVKKW